MACKASWFEHIFSGPENYKGNPGAVECILEVENADQLLIGYERGLVVLWDISAQQNLKVKNILNLITISTATSCFLSCV